MLKSFYKNMNVNFSEKEFESSDEFKERKCLFKYVSMILIISGKFIKEQYK